MESLRYYQNSTLETGDPQYGKSTLLQTLYSQYGESIHYFEHCNRVIRSTKSIRNTMISGMKSQPINLSPVIRSMESLQYTYYQHCNRVIRNMGSLLYHQQTSWVLRGMENQRITINMVNIVSVVQKVYIILSTL